MGQQRDGTTSTKRYLEHWYHAQQQAGDFFGLLVELLKCKQTSRFLEQPREANGWSLAILFCLQLEKLGYAASL